MSTIPPASSPASSRDKSPRRSWRPEPSSSDGRDAAHRSRRNGSSRHRRSSPRRRSISPRRRSISPRRRSISPRRRSFSPRRHDNSSPRSTGSQAPVQRLSSGSSRSLSASPAASPRPAASRVPVPRSPEPAAPSLLRRSPAPVLQLPAGSSLPGSSRLVKSLVIPSSGFRGVDPAPASPRPQGTPPRTPPLALPRTPGCYSSSEERPTRTILDFTRLPLRTEPEVRSTTGTDAPWDRMSPVSSRPSSPPPGVSNEAAPEVPLSWYTVVDTVYESGMIDPASIPASPPPVRSVIGGPPPAKRRRCALPPSPLTSACLPGAMRSCWGGPWPNHLQHQPPPANAALHPTPSVWVPDFRTKFHAGPGFDLKPARLSAREKEWATAHQPPVEHSWLTEIDMMARAQLSSISALEWILGVVFDSYQKSSPAQLLALQDFAARELGHASNFGGAIIAASTLARRKAVLDSVKSLPPTTKHWLQLQPVGLDSSQGLFGQASAAVPEIIRQQPPPPPQPKTQSFRRAPARPAARPTAAPQRPARPAGRRSASSTYTPTAAREASSSSGSRSRQPRSTSAKASKRRA